MLHVFSRISQLFIFLCVETVVINICLLPLCCLKWNLSFALECFHLIFKFTSVSTEIYDFRASVAMKWPYFKFKLCSSFWMPLCDCTFYDDQLHYYLVWSTWHVWGTLVSDHCVSWNLSQLLIYWLVISMFCLSSFEMYNFHSLMAIKNDIFNYTLHFVFPIWCWIILCDCKFPDSHAVVWWTWHEWNALFDSINLWQMHGVN